MSSLLPTFSDDPHHGLLVSCLGESKHLCQADLKAHYPPSTCASAASACGSQADNTLLDLWVKQDSGPPARPWLTVIMDDYGQAIAGLGVSGLR